MWLWYREGPPPLSQDVMNRHLNLQKMLFLMQARRLFAKRPLFYDSSAIRLDKEVMSGGHKACFQSLQSGNTDCVTMGERWRRKRTTDVWCPCITQAGWRDNSKSNSSLEQFLIWQCGYWAPLYPLGVLYVPCETEEKGCIAWHTAESYLCMSEMNWAPTVLGPVPCKENVSMAE